MNVVLPIVLGMMGLIVVISLVMLPRIWRTEADVQRPEVAQRSWQLGDAVRDGFLRGLPIGVVALLLLWLASAATFMEESTSLFTSSPWNNLDVWLGSGFLLAVAVDVCVTLFNRPKLVVPPAARDEPGALSLWWNSRDSGPS